VLLLDGMKLERAGVRVIPTNRAGTEKVGRFLRQLPTVSGLSEENDD